MLRTCVISGVNSFLNVPDCLLTQVKSDISVIGALCALFSDGSVSYINILLVLVLVLVRMAVDEFPVSVGMFMDQISPQEKIRVG